MELYLQVLTVFSISTATGTRITKHTRYKLSCNFYRQILRKLLKIFPRKVVEIVEKSSSKKTDLDRTLLQILGNWTGPPSEICMKWTLHYSKEEEQSIHLPSLQHWKDSASSYIPNLPLRQGSVPIDSEMEHSTIHIVYPPSQPNSKTFREYIQSLEE